MIDPAAYRARLLARVQSVKNAQDALIAERNSLQTRAEEYRTQLDAARADIAAMLAPLTRLGALLPESVRAILSKYQA